VSVHRLFGQIMQAQILARSWPWIRQDHDLLWNRCVQLLSALPPWRTDATPAGSQGPVRPAHRHPAPGGAGCTPREQSGLGLPTPPSSSSPTWSSSSFLTDHFYHPAATSSRPRQQNTKALPMLPSKLSLHA
jgi:hypothetical protein